MAPAARRRLAVAIFVVGFSYLQSIIVVVGALAVFALVVVILTPGKAGDGDRLPYPFCIRTIK